MEKTPANKLGIQNIGKLLFDMAYPAIVAQLVNVLYNIVDRMYIGHIPGIGAQALTGVGVTLPLIMAITAFTSLISMGGAPRAAIRMGRGEPQEAEKILGNCLVALVILAGVLTATLLLFGEKLLMLFGASQFTISYALDFMNVYAWGTLFVQLALGLNAFITAQGFAKISMLTILSGALLSIILDPIFIFTFGLGVKGAALANVIAQAISAAWVIHFLTGRKTILKIRKQYLRNDFKVFLPCLALGLSPFIMQLTECLLAITFNSSLQKYGGDLAVGAMTILSSIMQIAMLPLTGLTQGAQPIISFNYGAGNPARVKKTFLLLFKVVPLLFIRLVAADNGVSPSFHPDIHRRSGVDSLFDSGLTNLYGHFFAAWNPNQLPTDVYRTGKCKKLNIFGTLTESVPVDSPHLYLTIALDR